jgi:aspartate racemase
MKTLGMIGGTGYPSTIEYYRLINEQVNERLGGLNFARCIIYSFNYGDIDALNWQQNMEGLYKLISEAVDTLIVAGAEGILLGANTIHMFADRLQEQIPVPIIHIADATGDAILKKGLKKVALLGTRHTMELDFYRTRLQKKQIEVLIPEAGEREFIHKSILDELVKNIFTPDMKNKYLDIISSLEQKGAEGIILGCTEIPLLVEQKDCDIPLFDTLNIHATAAVEFIVND